LVSVSHLVAEAASVAAVAENEIDLNRLTTEMVIFEGSAREACRGFPRHVNVPAVLSLAGVGAEKTWVRAIASPDCSFNEHHIEVRGKFGRLLAEIENVPSPTNPHTGLLSSFSSIQTLPEYARTREKSAWQRG
jgi:aspartate dehydrogenase